MILKNLDFCFYCGHKLPRDTFPHVCRDCLTCIQRGESPHSLLIQKEIDGETGLKKSDRVPASQLNYFHSS